MARASLEEIKTINHYYIYVRKEGRYFYKTTLPTRYYAEQRVKELEEKELYEQVLYLKNHIIRNAFY